MITSEELEKVLFKPGLCNLKELTAAREFIEDLKYKLNIYITAAGHEPRGLTLDSNLDNLQYYFNRF